MARLVRVFRSRISPRYRQLAVVLAVAVCVGVAAGTYSFFTREFVPPGTLEWRAICMSSEDFDPDGLLLQCFLDDDLLEEGADDAVERCRSEGMENQSACQGSISEIRERGGLDRVESCDRIRQTARGYPDRSWGPECQREIDVLFRGGPRWDDAVVGGLAALLTYAASLLVVGSLRVLAPPSPRERDLPM